MRGVRAKGRTARIPTEMMQLVAKLWHLNLPNALAVSARPGINIHNQQRVVEVAAWRIKRRYKRMLFSGSLHRQTRRRIKRRVRFQERHKCLSGYMLHLITSSRAKFQCIVQPIPSRKQSHHKLNFIRAKSLAARTEIFCAQNLASRLVALSHPILQKKMPA